MFNCVACSFLFHKLVIWWVLSADIEVLGPYFGKNVKFDRFYVIINLEEVELCQTGTKV